MYIALLFINRYIWWKYIDLFQKMSANASNKEELGAAYLQEMYDVSGNPNEVCYC